MKEGISSAQSPGEEAKKGAAMFWSAAPQHLEESIGDCWRSPPLLETTRDCWTPLETTRGHWRPPDTGSLPWSLAVAGGLTTGDHRRLADRAGDHQRPEETTAACWTPLEHHPDYWGLGAEFFQSEDKKGGCPQLALTTATKWVGEDEATCPGSMQRVATDHQSR